ncbi:pilus (MSHA type) biogenesis protein MshL [Bordetella bronchiseptica]|uniref:Type II secretion system protein n=1 Tax=Bordetella bronchiseptica (strain ATCC BAA-588 / NCTC 13252 / RB50) TaxID=257310 RepID=A0A0H3LI31_BORBR|nr:pilus (MSHA type) biogenesis protein MshL [Bordetella bronchiseptica]AMG87296.1 pilus (MSHA type) biogenesis protein MshL [Bordetella bronchiseptica]AWP78465.1 pilus (MSHA type) biogenesis protein MshL [Bordetella bronchiseptica]AWP83280.1 pilus (MSHA type) biogenesis protein MshL [Bordetella bronchiseptica]AWQ08848.1 pilus (MSHA type) biogenesis protein MshL [Bordetella bronchiseptica]AXT90770.1 pilus (MSHA type) biogenesis protein MshL [Bordetella bronchiseptica]
MKSRSFAPLAPLALVLALAGCADTPRSVQNFPKTDHAALQTTSNAVAEESAKLLAHNDEMLQRVQRIQPTVPKLDPIAPQYDPLEDKIISVNMHDAKVGQLLWALSDQLRMNLVVDPQVLDMPQRASLYLQRVSAREVFDRILQVFDLHGAVHGNVLTVSLMQERVFTIEMLGGNTALDIQTGGDVFGGSGSSGGSSTLRGDLKLSGKVGDDADAYKQLAEAIGKVLEDTSSGVPGGAPAEKSRYSLDRTTGSLYVRARPAKVRAVEELIRRNQATIRRQIQVEAQLIDIELNDGFEFGVDWNLLTNHLSGRYGSGAITANTPAGTQPGSGLLPRSINIPAQVIGSAAGVGGGIGFANDSFSVALNALRSFGSVKVLSNPTVRVRNGVPAYLSVGANVRYVTEISTTFNNIGGGSSNSSSDVQTDSLFSGVVVGVAPFIHEDGRVELFVHPMQTQVQPQSLALVDVGNGNSVTLPIINTKSITTTLNLNNGDTVVLGGLIDQQFTNANKGLPGLSDIPGAGVLFDNRSDSHKSRELVIILRVRVI